MKLALSLLFFSFAFSFPSSAAPFDITEFGATPGDETDDTHAIERALAACAEAGGGTVHVPAGVFLLSRHGPESPILEIPPNTTFRGEGHGSTLKFTDEANRGNFWRMMGAPAASGTRNVVISDLHLDGSNTHPAYIKGETPEHNAGIWFYSREHVIENITVRNVFAENFAGDCIAISSNCRAVTIRDCTLRNFIRQGIQMGGSEIARDYLVTGCRDLEHTVKPGGSTIHVEHARGLRNVIIENNHCRKSILAGGVDGMIIRGNTIEGRLVGNSNRNCLIQNNLIRAASNASSILQFGYCKGLLIEGNLILGESEANTTGIYIWGESRYNSQPGENVTVRGNQISARTTGISLNGVRNVRIAGNLLSLSGEENTPVSIKRAAGVVSDRPRPDVSGGEAE